MSRLASSESTAKRRRPRASIAVRIARSGSPRGTRFHVYDGQATAIASRELVGYAPIMTTWTSTDSKNHPYAGNVLSASRQGDRVTFEYDYAKGSSSPGKFTGTLSNDTLSGAYEEQGGGKKICGAATLKRKVVEGQRHTFSGRWWETAVPSDHGSWTVDLDL
jgi:hypothetical protein